LDKQRWEAPTPIDTVRTEIPPAVASVVQKLMAKRPAERYQTPSELARVLQAMARAGYRGPGAALLALHQRLAGHADLVWSACFSPDGRRVASGGKDGTLLLWNASDGTQLRSMPKHAQEVRAVAFVGETGRLLSASGLTVRLFDTETALELRRFSRHAASAHFDTIIRLWDLASGAELRRFEGHRQMVSSLAFTPDGRWLLSGSQDQTLRLWDVETACELSSVPSQAGGINAVALSAD